MASEQGYDARVSPSAGAMPALPTGQGGAMVGEAVQGLGQTVHRVAIDSFTQARKLEADRQLADRSHQFAQGRAAIDEFETKRQNGPIDGYTQDMAAQVQALRESVLAGVTEGSVQRALERQFDEYGDRVHEHSVAWEEGQRTGKVVVDEAATQKLQTGRVYTRPDTWQQELTLGMARIEAMLVPPEVKAKLHNALDQGLGKARATGMAEADPMQLLKDAASGAYDFLGEETLGSIVRQAQVNVRTNLNAIERAKQAESAQIGERFEALKIKAGDGVDVSAALPEFADYYRRTGDLKKQAEIAKMAHEAGFAKMWTPATPMQREQRLTQLAAVPPEKRSEDQQSEFAWLSEHRKQLDDRFYADPVGATLEHGQPGEMPPELVPGDAQSYQDYATWAQSRWGLWGRKAVFTDAAAKARALRLREGSAGYAEVVNELATFPPAVARAAARQVDGGDAYLQQLVTLRPDVRKAAIDGREVMRADPKAIELKFGDVRRAKAIADGFEAAYSAGAQGDRNAVIVLARNIAAEEVHRTGVSMSPALFERSLNKALGAQGSGADQRGGMAGWTNGLYFLVPQDQTANQFARDVFDKIRRHPEQAPANPDGSPANLNKARPIALGSGRYKFMVGQQDVLRADRKGPWIFTAGDRR